MAHHRSRPLRPTVSVLRPLVAVLVVAGLVVAGLLVTGPERVNATLAPATDPAAASAPAPVEGGRTWVVDAVDDSFGAKWRSVNTETSEVRVQVGDTVEWQFDIGTAAQEHDLTSLNTGATWEPAVQEYRVPGGPPVRHTFTAPGVYHYWCSIHGTVMRGTVVVEEPGDQAPSVTAAADPATGPAPLDVHFTGQAADAQGGVLTYAWDFGVDGTDGDAAPDTAAGADATYQYADPGTYTATLAVTDIDGNVGSDTVNVAVTDEVAEPPPAINATATPASGGAPLDVALSTEVTTTGSLMPFADGLTSYPDLAGAAVMVRSRGDTFASLEVSGVKPGAYHMVHVHEQPCSQSNGGAHFRFDEAQPFSEANEIWLHFTSDAEGRSGPVAVTQGLRAGPKAVSVVVHDPDNPAKRIGCADLAPGTADLAYAWDFGDGTTGAGAHPDHTYTEPGNYSATVTVSREHADHDSTVTPITDSVVVAVADTTGPVIRDVQPVGFVRDRTPPVRATVSDRYSRVRGRDLALRIDGRVVTGFGYDALRDRLAWTPRRALAPGRHTMRLVAVDVIGNRTVERWRFWIRR